MSSVAPCFNPPTTAAHVPGQREARRIDPAAETPPERTLAQRADEIYSQQRCALSQLIDRSFGILMLCQWLACVAGALWLSPKEWGGTVSGTHLHVWAAWFLGGVITCLPVLMVAWRPGEALTRHSVAVGQMLMSALLIHVSGGRLETHFHVFGSLAFLAFYRDWKVLITASLVVSLDHFLRGAYWPQSVFGVVAVSPWRWAEHTAWIIFEDIFLIISIRHNQQILHDIAYRRAELEQAKEAAEQANRAKDDFLAVLSHELRTPLTPSLVALSALVTDPEVPSEYREEIQMVQRNVEMEARLIDDLLDLTRIGKGKIQLIEGAVDVHAILLHILEASRAELIKKQITVGRALESKEPWVYGDAARLQQVFWNLLKNAIKFTPEGGCIVVRTSDADGMIRVDITDTGLGIAKEIMGKLFRPFQQGGVTVTRRFGGLGLGLSICRGIVELHHGTIRAQSEGEGKGATFTVELPVHVPAEEPDGYHCEQSGRVGPRSRRILLVDDHTDTRHTLARLLSRAGYEVTTAESVGSALQKAMDARFDLLISDIGLPDGTGRDLMSVLNTRFGLRGIAFSGFGMEGDVRKSLDAGFSAHLTKPVDFQRLKDEMVRALEEGNAALS